MSEEIKVPAWLVAEWSKRLAKDLEVEERRARKLKRDMVALKTLQEEQLYRCDKIRGYLSDIKKLITQED